MGVVALIYAIFTIVAFASTLSWHYTAMTERPSMGLKSVFLSEVPLHQTFTADRLAGVRIWVFTDNPVDYGAVVVTIGDEETGTVFVRGEIEGENIKRAAEGKYLDFAMSSEQGMIEEADKYFVELSTSGIAENSFKTLLAIADDEPVQRDGDEELLEGKQLCFVPLCKSISDAFVYWIPATSIFLIVMVLIAAGNTKHNRAGDARIPSGKNLIIAGGLAVAALVSIAIMTTAAVRIEIVDNKSEDLAEGGYTLSEHSFYVEDFVLENKNLRAVRVYLPYYLDNTPLFVVSLQDEEGNVLATAQSNEMELIGKGGYRLDVSGVELEKGKVYDLFIFTGFIEENEEKPVIARIEYEYSK